MLWKVFSRININQDDTSLGGANEENLELPPPVRLTKDHPVDQIIGELSNGVQTRRI